MTASSRRISRRDPGQLDDVEALLGVGESWRAAAGARGWRRLAAGARESARVSAGGAERHRPDRGAVLAEVDGVDARSPGPGRRRWRRGRTRAARWPSRAGSWPARTRYSWVSGSIQVSADVEGDAVVEQGVVGQDAVLLEHARSSTRRAGAASSWPIRASAARADADGALVVVGGGGELGDAAPARAAPVWISVRRCCSVLDGLRPPAARRWHRCPASPLLPGPPAGLAQARRASPTESAARPAKLPRNGSRWSVGVGLGEVDQVARGSCPGSAEPSAPLARRGCGRFSSRARRSTRWARYWRCRISSALR